MLLDLDQGSMTVYKNDERLGVMATGLSSVFQSVSLDLDQHDATMTFTSAACCSLLACVLNIAIILLVYYYSLISHCRS